MFIGAPDKHNVYEAEVVGVVLALWILERTPVTIGKQVSIYTDNQSVVTSILHPKATSGQHVLCSLRAAIEGTGCILVIKWISGHRKVKGNEEADKLAKDAAAGHSSARVDLPPILRRLLPTSASAFKQEFMKRMKIKWVGLWEVSPRKLRVSQFGDSFPFSALLDRLNLLTRRQASLILQLRCGHFPLNIYLHRIKKVNSDKCTACNEGQPETINHFIFDCAAHIEARNELVKEIGLNHFHFPDIMSNVNRMRALTTYINRSV